MSGTHVQTLTLVTRNQGEWTQAQINFLRNGLKAERIFGVKGQRNAIVMAGGHAYSAVQVQTMVNVRGGVRTIELNGEHDVRLPGEMVAVP